MSWSLWLSLSLSYISVAGGTGKTLDLRQPNKIIRLNVGQSVSLPCQVKLDCKDANFQWFIFKENSHYQIDLKARSSEYNLQGSSLHISSVSSNHSGVYYCAAVLPETHKRGAQEIGNGTTLEIRKSVPMVSYILLWSLFALLASYSLVIIILIISKKTKKDIFSCRGAWRTTEKKYSTKRKQLRAVMQEMSSRQNLRNSAPKADNVASSQNKAESHESNPSADDIYQNL